MLQLLRVASLARGRRCPPLARRPVVVVSSVNDCSRLLLLYEACAGATPLSAGQGRPVYSNKFASHLLGGGRPVVYMGPPHAGGSSGCPCVAPPGMDRRVEVGTGPSTGPASGTGWQPKGYSYSTCRYL